MPLDLLYDLPRVLAVYPVSPHGRLRKSVYMLTVLSRFKLLAPVLLFDARGVVLLSLCCTLPQYGLTPPRNGEKTVQNLYRVT